MDGAKTKSRDYAALITSQCAASGYSVKGLEPIGDGALNLHWSVDVGEDAPLVARMRAEDHPLLNRHWTAGEARAMTLARKAGVWVPEVRGAGPEVLLMESFDGTADRETVLARFAEDEDLRVRLSEQIKGMQSATALPATEDQNVRLRSCVEAYALLAMARAQGFEFAATVQAVCDAAVAAGADTFALSHGDLRTGNLLVTDQRFAGLLDWEFAAYRPVEADIGWFLSSPWRYSRPDMAGSGLMDRAEVLERFERPDTARLRAWEAVALMRWLVIGHLQDKRQGLPAGTNADPEALCSEALELIQLRP